MLLEGIFPAITTPFYPDGSLYFKKLEHNVDIWSRTPAAGMVVLGSTGEAVMLNDAEQREVLKISAMCAAPHKVLIAGVGQESTRNTLTMCEYAAECGYDVALVRTPTYYRTQLTKEDVSGQLAHYRFIADRSPLPVLLYSVPPMTAYDLPVETVAELSGHPNIIGIKESSGSAEKIAAMRAATKNVKRKVNVTEVFMAVTSRMLKAENASDAGAVAQGGILPVESLTGGTAPTKTINAVAEPPARVKFKMRTKEIGFTIMAGSAQGLLAALRCGANAGVLAFASPAPQACYEVYTAWKEDDQPLAELKQQRIAASATRIAGQMGISALKYAMELNGYYGGPARMPLLPLTATDRADVEKLMVDIRN
jgi:4-hydroxy-2-oxoglutarate aldolase